jgi:DNA mismatch repair ATPase MutS
MEKIIKRMKKLSVNDNSVNPDDSPITKIIKIKKDISLYPINYSDVDPDSNYQILVNHYQETYDKYKNFDTYDSTEIAEFCNKMLEREEYYNEEICFDTDKPYYSDLTRLQKKKLRSVYDKLQNSISQLKSVGEVKKVRKATLKSIYEFHHNVIEYLEEPYKKNENVDVEMSNVANDDTKSMKKIIIRRKKM